MFKLAWHLPRNSVFLSLLIWSRELHYQLCQYCCYYALRLPWRCSNTCARLCYHENWSLLLGPCWSFTGYYRVSWPGPLVCCLIYPLICLGFCLHAWCQVISCTFLMPCNAPLTGLQHLSGGSVPLPLPPPSFLCDLSQQVYNLVCCPALLLMGALSLQPTPPQLNCIVPFRWSSPPLRVTGFLLCHSETP